MGITGLLPFLEKASTKGNIGQFAGCTVAIDSYCWLHKGAFSCAEKLALGEPTDAYVTYCMRYINMLLAHRIKPILVFDGCHLPAKKETESKRRELREKNRKQAAQLMKLGQMTEGKSLLRRSIDVSHEMALNLIKACHEIGVDCIVAPYEADSQLAYLNLSGIADIIITEDSDLTLFGCRKIFFKMDVLGNGVLVEQERFHLALGVRSEHFSMDKFRYMCILSGCDYLASLPGIGLSKALKFINKTAETDMHKALARLPSYLNMKSLDVTKEYRDSFIRADVTFKHQLVFCPFKRKQVRLTPPTPDVTAEQLHFAGKEMPEDLAWQLAIGNYDPMSLKKLHDYDPDTFTSRKSLRRTNSWMAKPTTTHNSIWSTDFKIDQKVPKTEKEVTTWPDTFGKVAVLKTASITRTLISPKRNYEEVEEIEPEDLLKIYASKETDNKRSCQGIDISAIKLNTSEPEEREKSPVMIRRANPFAKQTQTHEVSPSLLDKGKQRSKFRGLARFKPTVIDDNVLTKSKFFARLSDPSSDNCSEIPSKEDGPLKNGSDLIPRVNDERTELECDRENDERLAAADDKQETPRKPVTIQESMSVSDSMYEMMLPKAASALPEVEDSSILMNGATSTPPNHVFNSQSQSAKPNLSMWSNPKSNGSAQTLLSISAMKNPSSCVTLRGIQGAAKSTRAPRTGVNRKFQPVKRKTQVEQGQQCLLSSFGFQKKTSLQH